MPSRGIRNHNPGNIKDFGIPWKGILDHERRSERQKLEQTFVVFSAPWWGIRAMAIILKNYQIKYGIRTLRGAITRWAPASDSNPTSHYVDYVSEGWIHPDQEVDLQDYQTLETLIRRIVLFENGSDPYSWEYQIGLILAGVEPNPIT